jgi:chemotaxis protein MotA
MDISTLLGLLLGFGSLIVATLLEGGSPASFIQISAMLIVFGGTIGATLTGYPLESVKKLPVLVRIALKKLDLDAHALIDSFVALAEKARKNGLLSLEAEAQQIKDPFTQQAIMLAIDGTEAETLKTILETQLEYLEERHEVLIGMLEAMGGFAPTMGIIGTVMGLVRVLSNLSDPNSLGPKIAVAFIATLWGVSSANLIWLPLGNKLKRKNHEEAFYRRVVIEGVLAVQSGENPRLVRQKLEGMVPQFAKNAKQSNAAEASEQPREEKRAA